MPLINVKYFASLKEKTLVESETLTFEGSYKDLYFELSKKYQFTLPFEMIQVAVNDEFSSMNSMVTENAKVVFIPPVAGG